MVKRRSKRSSSSSKSSSGTSSTDSFSEDLLEGMEGIFLEDTKVRLVADRFPGLLASETLQSMRRSLLSSAGEEQEDGAGRPVAVLYYRQILSKRTGGAQSRELLNIATAVDYLLKGRPCHALDVLTKALIGQWRRRSRFRCRSRQAS